MHEDLLQGVEARVKIDKNNNEKDVEMLHKGTVRLLHNANGKVQEITFQAHGQDVKENVKKTITRNSTNKRMQTA